MSSEVHTENESEAFLAGYLEGVHDGYLKAISEVMYPGCDEEDWPSLDEEIIPIEDLLAIERIKHEYAINHDYYSIPVGRVA
jgi:hypothetical protein